MFDNNLKTNDKILCDKFTSKHHLKVNESRTSCWNFKCSVCYKTFNRLSFLKRHLRIHNRNVKYIKSSPVRDKKILMENERFRKLNNSDEKKLTCKNVKCKKKKIPSNTEEIIVNNKEVCKDASVEYCLSSKKLGVRSKNVLVKDVKFVRKLDVSCRKLSVNNLKLRGKRHINLCRRKRFCRHGDCDKNFTPNPNL